MRVLVTGGAGYLGSVFVPTLLYLGHKVTVLDSFAHGVPSLLGSCASGSLAIVRGDARDPLVVDHLIKLTDAVVALAAIVGQAAGEADPTTAFTVNAQAVRHLVSRLRPEQRLIYPCTNSGYGLAGETECTETSPLVPTSAYGRSKVLGERYALEHPHAVSLRFATLFGASPRLRLDLMVNDFVYRAVRGQRLNLFEGRFRRNFLHVQDAALAIAWALQHDQLTGIFNAGDDRANLTKLALCEKIRDRVPSFTWHEATGYDPDRRDYVVSSAKLAATGWTPTRSLDDGIEELRIAYVMPLDRARHYQN